MWGRLVESAVATHLINQAIMSQAEIFYWREGNQEVDFIVKYNRTITTIEVKSSHKRAPITGITTFNVTFKPDRLLLIGNSGMPLEQFFLTPFEELFA